MGKGGSSENESGSSEENENGREDKEGRAAHSASAPGWIHD